MIEKERVRNIMAGVQINKISLVGIHRDDKYITLHTLIAVKARDYTVSVDMPIQQAKQEAEKAAYTYFSEIYSFTKSADAVGKGKLIDGECPACGDSVGYLSDVNKCKSCGTFFSSGEFDWVLSEITQTKEFKNPGNNEKVVTGFNQQILEDRAATVFWRYIFASASNDIRFLHRHATDNFLKIFKKREEYVKEPAIGFVNLVDLSHESAFHYSKFLISWSLIFSSENYVNYRTNVTMKLSEQSQKKSGFADVGCLNCGAPLPDDDSSQCSYCDAKFDEKVNDWLLDEIFDS